MMGPGETDLHEGALCMCDTTGARKYGNVLVLGLGKTGEAVAIYLSGLVQSGRVSSVTVYGGLKSEPDPTTRLLEEAGVRVVCGTERVEGSYDTCISSPGISEFSDFYKSAEAASTETFGEPELAWRESPERWVGITGTNGKTTTTTLITHILECAGERVAAVGNIGNTCIQAVAKGAAHTYVVETSSFQLASMGLFAPDVAVLLNITPDHLYWHMTFDAYVEAKKRIYARLADTRGTLVIDGVCDVTRACIKEFKDDPERGFDYVALGSAAGLHASMKDSCGADNAAFLDGDILRVDFGERRIDLVRTGELHIKGEHNASNALAAAAAALACGVAPDAVREGLRTFEPLEHRLEPCGSIGGVSFVNDSKATNVDATLKALSAFRPGTAVFLLGGHDKGTDLSELVAEASAVCKAVVCFGAAGPRFYEAFEDASSPVRRELVEHMEDALDAAIAIAEPGDEVVLSPACSSFDEFESFEHRGKVFKLLVAFRAEQARKA